MKYSPIFIVGPPRSGSTLLYQLIARHFRVCYFSNFMMYFSSWPGSISRLLALSAGCDPPPRFDSFYGQTAGWRSPNQGERVWGRWFPHDYSHVGPGVLSAKTKLEMHNTIALIQESFKAPFVNKWQAHTARILAIAEAIPEALFIRITRDPALIAQSILHGKRKLFENERAWFSSKPRNYEQLKHKKPLEQACGGVFHLEKDIDHDCEIIGRDRFMKIHYEDLCKSPRAVMATIKWFYSNSKKSGSLVARHKIPSSFHLDRTFEVTLEELNEIKTRLSCLECSFYLFNWSSKNKGQPCITKAISK